MVEITKLRYIFIDHSNIWGGARLASKMNNPEIPDWLARIKIRFLDDILEGRKQGTSMKIVSGGVPPGMEGVWEEYKRAKYDTQCLFKDENWKERGVDHTIIGHMWKILAQHREHPVCLVLASGDGQRNEFGTSYFEVIKEVLSHKIYQTWDVELYSFDWPMPNKAGVRSPTNQSMRKYIVKSERGRFINLTDYYDKLVFHQRDL